MDTRIQFEPQSPYSQEELYLEILSVLVSWQGENFLNPKRRADVPAADIQQCVRTCERAAQDFPAQWGRLVSESQDDTDRRSGDGLRSTV